MKILIAGSNGLIGSRLSNLLKIEKHEIILLNRNNLSSKNLSSFFSQVDIVINCIGVDMNNSSNYAETKKINYTIPIKLLNLSCKSKVKYFFFISSFHVYDQSVKKKINENTKLKITNNYNKSKILCEKKIIKKKNIKIIIIRSCNLFGLPNSNSKNCWNTFINNLIKNLSNNRTFIIKSYFDQSRNYSSIESFCVFISNIISNINRINFKKNYFLTNYTTNMNLRISEVIKIILYYFRSKKKLVKYKYSDYISRPVIYNYQSIHQKKFKKLNDKYFYKEIKRIISFFK